MTSCFKSYLDYLRTIKGFDGSQEFIESFFRIFKRKGISNYFTIVIYDETVEQARDEQSEGVRPDLKTMAVDVEGCDTVYLVFPNWWGDLPMPVYSFFDACDFTFKIAVRIFY